MTTLTLLYCERDNLFVEVRQLELFLTDDLGNFDSSSQKNVNFLLLGNLLSISEKFLHAVVVGVFKEIFEAVLDTKLLISIGQDSNVNH